MCIDIYRYSQQNAVQYLLFIFSKFACKFCFHNQQNILVIHSNCQINLVIKSKVHPCTGTEDLYRLNGP